VLAISDISPLLVLISHLPRKHAINCHDGLLSKCAGLTPRRLPWDRGAPVARRGGRHYAQLYHHCQTPFSRGHAKPTHVVPHGVRQMVLADSDTFSRA
jgi:hypothetical protein